MQADRNSPKLFGIATTAENDFAICAAAEAAGWRLIAEGSFSAVFERDGQILKIFHDPAYLAFITTIVNPENTAFPIILDGPFIGEHLSAVILEPLTALSQKDMNIVATIHALVKSTEWRGFDENDPKAIALQDQIGTDGVSAIDQIVSFAVGKRSGIGHRRRQESHDPPYDRAVRFRRSCLSPDR